MSEKFDMKLVIDEVTTPLLHARLSAARSPRERAAVLRSLAESALRSASGGVVFHPDNVAVRLPDMDTVASRPIASDRATPIASRSTDPGQDVNRQPVTNERQSGSHDTQLLADEFAGYY
ncbi:hypothetical protein ACAX43_29790 [Paraburkholderia sp. IW21]|uniref:hypothetical protein n=1 Tax=Paraburkholderia sp. IW21 TaxID=3242488 RepID=UPI003520A434